jgi:solute carrier family 30 (zinc transporter), member 1
MLKLFKSGETHLHSHSHGKNKENLHAHSHLNERKSNNLTDEKFLETKKSNDDLNPIEMGQLRRKNKKSKLNLNIRGVLLHVLADALGSVSVIVSSLLVKYLPSNEKEFQWKFYVDPILSLVISFFIIISTIPLFRQSSLILLQAIPHEINFEQLKKEICKIKSLQKIESFHVWSLNSELVVASINLSLSSENSEQLEVFNRVQKILKDYNINLSSIQISIDSQNSTNEISNLNANMSNLTFNELRNDRNENAIFDLSKNIEI